MQRDYEVFAILFGVRNSIEAEPIACRRGLPDKLSFQAELELKEWPKIFDASWISYGEIKQVQWETPLWRTWDVLFEMMAVLASNYGDENVRLVVWFDQ